MWSSLKLGREATVDWRSFSTEVTYDWFENQEAIGGVGFVLEVDETLLLRRRYERGRVLSKVWLFGGIEWSSKKRFIIPLNYKEVGTKRNQETLVPHIKKYVKAGTTICNDM